MIPAGTGYIRFFLRLTLALAILLPIAGCTSSRHVPDGKLMLDQVKISIDSTSSGPEIDTQALQAYLRQEPNHKMLWSIKFRLGFYNLSGRDTTKFWNRWARRLGEAPVIYDSLLTAESARQLQKVLVNKGYLKAKVEIDSVVDHKKKKTRIGYRLKPGPAYLIDSLALDIADPTIAALLKTNRGVLRMEQGDPLDRTLLDDERQAIVNLLRDHGYFSFRKEEITFEADTAQGSTDVALTLRISAPKQREGTPETDAGLTSGNIVPGHTVWRIRRVIAVTDYDPVKDIDLSAIQRQDTVDFKGIRILYGAKEYLRPKTIYENCFLLPGEIFRQRDTDRTYSALSRLQILNFVNIRLVPSGSSGQEGLLDAYILLTPGKPMTAAVELEGTNSAGDIGVAVGLSFSHRNIGRGSETLSAKVSGSYEALSGKLNLDNILHNRYMEYGGDLSLTFPRFMAPFLSEKYQKKVNASSVLNVTINYQERPEYTRIITTAGWAYKWSDRHLRWRQTLTPIDINYVYLPRTSYDFIDRIAPDNPLLRYSYEDHFIMRLGYNFYITNRRIPNSGVSKLPASSFYTLRGNIETAGNLLFGLSNLFDPGRNFSKRPYELFGIRYSQYVKLDADLSYLLYIDHRNSIAFHAGGGIGCPYANSAILPFEKRFYGGGANGVRGWAVRTLGPGRYPGVNSVSDFINQCGDIRLLFNAEYRTKLFWVLELGLFVDAGNIWTIRDYENQPGGVFLFNRFYEQIAGAYGLGLRLDFNYFLLRFDLGMKAYNPASGEYHWPIIRPRWHRDSAFHFSIGYPF